MDTPNRKDNLTQLLGFLKKNGYAGKELRLDDFDARMQDESIRRNLYNALSRDKVPDIGSWNEFSSMVKKEKSSTAQAQPSTRAGSTPLVPNSPLLPSPNKANKNTLSTDWTRPTPQFSIPTSERNPGVPTLVPSREHPYVGRELAFVSPSEVTNLNTGKKHYDASKTSVIYPDEIGEDNTRKAIDNYTQAKASEANRLDRKIEAQLQDIEKQQKELEERLNKRAKELEAEREGEGWFVNFIRSQPARGMDPMSTINRLTNDGKDQDEEYIGISSALHNLRKQKEKLLATKKSMQEDASFGSFLKNAGRGFVDTVTDTRIWDGAEGDLREAGLAIKAIGKLELQKKFNSGQATKEDAELLRTLYKGQLKLTPAEDALLNSKAGRAYVDSITKEAIGYGYGAGETTANMLPFIRDIALSPVNGLGRTVATNVAKSALKSGLSRVATKAISRTARVVSDIALEGAGTALTTGMGGTLKGAADEQIGDIKYDVDSKTGQIVYGGRTNQEENFLKAFGKSLVRQALEYGTEATGGAYIGTLMKPINKYGGKLLTKTLGDKAVSAVEKFFARMEKTSVGKAVNSVGEQVHYDGLPGEYLEEVYNNLLNAVTIGDMKLDTNSNNGVFNPEINKTIIIGLMGAPMATVSLKVGSIVAQDTKTQAMGLRAFGYKQWQEMKTLIGNSDDVSKTISEWAEQNPNATSNQKKAVMRYAVATAMEDAMTVRQALEQKERKKDSATTLTPSQTAEQSGEASAVAPNPPSSSTSSESADNTFNPNSDNSKRYEQGNGVILKREDGTSVRAQIVSEENEDGKIEVASSEGAIQGRDRVVYLTREELDQMYQGSFDIDSPDASSNEETQQSNTSIDSTPASPTPNSDSPIGRPMTEEEAVSFVDKMTAEAEEAPELELTAENWDKEFGDNGVVDTPIGKVHMGEHQFLKMMRQGRNSKLGMIKPTLTNPDIIIEDTSREASSSERSSSYIFAKSFKGTDGERIYYFTSITVSQDGNEVVISNQERRKNRILSLMNSGNILYQKSNSLHPKAQVGESVPLNESLSVTNADNNSDQLGIHSSAGASESKDSNKVANIKSEEEGSDHSTQEALSETPHSEERSEEHEWDELAKQVGDESAREIISSDISDLEAERKKLQKEISKPKGQTREEKIQYVIGRRERLQSIDAEIEGLQRVLQVPQMRIAQAEAQERNGTEGTSEPSRTGGRSQTDSREVESNKPTFLDVIRTLYEKGKEVASKLFGRSHFNVADTSNLLKELGLTGDKFTIRYGVISRHFGKDAQHKLPLNVWSQLPEALNKPLIITKYYTDKTKTKQKGYRIYTAIQLEDGAFVIAGVEVKNAGRNLEVNAIDTVFGRNNIIGTQEEIVYESKEMTPEQRTLLDGHNPHRYSDTQESSNASDSKGSKKTTNLTRSEKEAVIAQAEQEVEELRTEASTLRRKAYQAMRDYYESGAVPDMTEAQFEGEAVYMFIGSKNRNELALIHAPGLQDILTQLDELADKIPWYELLIRNSKKALNAEQNTEHKGENENTRKSEDNSTEGIRFRKSQEELEEVNDRFNEELQAQIDGTLPKGHVYSLGMPSAILKSAGIPNLPIELTASRVSLKSGQEKHPFPIKILSNLPQMLQKPIAVFHYGDKAMNVIVEIEYDGRDLLVGLVLNQDRNGIEVNDVRGLFPKDTAKWLNWITQGKAIYLNKEIIQTKITQQRTNLAEVGHLNLDDLTKVIKEFENPNIEENAFDDDILFRGRYVEFQSGYTERADGTPISNNAKYAEEAGKFPASLFKKKYGISPADFNMLNDLGLIEISEWHHTGATFRETDYYSWVDNAIFDNGYNSIRGYDINGEYEYNEQGEATYVGEDENPSMPLSEWYKQNKKAIKPIADAYKAGEWTWEREDPSVGLHRIKNREDAERRMIETHFRKEERQYRNIHWGEYPQSLKNLFSTMLKWDENAHYEDIEAEAERLANEFYDAHIEETLEADRKNIEEGEAKNRAIREKNLSSASKETALMALAKLYGMDEQEAYNKISSSSWYNRGSLRRRSTSSDEASEHNPLHAEMEREATRLTHSMGEEVVVVHNEEELVDILGEDGARQARGAKGFYLPKSGKVVIILSNNTDVADVLETIFHEFVGHKGLQEYVGKEEFTAFIDRVHRGIHSKALREIHDEAKQIFKERKGTSRAVSYQEAVREATEEYIARLSERGFSDRESRSTWQKIVDAFRDMISRAKLTLGWNIQDRDIRYILWKSFQMKQKQVAILAEAGDIAMRHRLGLPQKVKVTEGVRERRGGTSEDAEMGAIKAQAKKDGTFMKAPNGKPTKLTEKQWLQVRTQAFKNWFGDWLNTPENASKVVDENGEPMIVYHGSKNKFYSFDMGLQKTAWMGKGFYFTPNKEFAKSFGRSVVSSFLNLRNPFIVKGNSPSYYDSEVGKIYGKDGGPIEPSEGTALLQDKGHDGVLFTHWDQGQMITVFTPSQIKSATENKGTFDKSNDDIRYRKIDNEMRSVPSELDNKLAITTLSPSTEIPVMQTEKRSVSTAEAKQAIESLPKQVVTMDGYALNVSKKTKHKLGNSLSNSTREDYRQALTLLTQIVGNSVLIEEHRNRVKIDGERKADNPNDTNIENVQRFYGAITIGKVTYRVKTTAIVSANTEQGTRMHNYDITEIELLQPETPVSRSSSDQERSNSISEIELLPSSPTENSQELAPRSNSISLAKLLNGVGFSYEPERKILDEMQGGTEGIRFRQGQKLQEVNDRFNEQLDTLTEENANSVILSLGSPSPILQGAGVSDKPMRLYGNKVIKKMKKHGFSLSELRDLPRAVANPIAVFSTHGDGSHAILTEIKSNKGNILVALEVGRGGADIDFNLITSTYGKNKDKIVQWFNTGVASYIDKEKALEYLASAPAPIAGAKQAQELSSATKVIESFENPSIEEKSSDLTNGIRFRPGNNSQISWNESAAKTEYNRTTRITDENGNKSKSANWLWRLREAYQDSMLSLKALQDALAKNALGRDLRDFEDAYTAENAMGSKNLSEMEHYDARYVKPLTDAISELMKEGASYEDILNYLRAKHGLERNEYYNAQDRAAAKDKWDSKEVLKQQKNPNYQPKEFEYKGEFKDYSGLTGLTGSSEDFTKLAQDMVEEFENKFNTDALWTSVRNANQKTLELGRQKNLISKQTYEHIKGMFEYYVPLRGWNSDRAEDEWEYLDGAGTMSGNSIRKSAKGRTSVSDDPIAMMIKLAEDTVRQGNRNMMKLKFLNLAENADDSLLQHSRAWFQKKIDQEGNEYWELVTPDIDDDASPEEISEALLEFNQNMNNLKELGEATQYPPKDSRKNISFDKNGSLGERKQHTVTVYRGGQLYTIFVNGNPRAAQAINGTINAGMYSGQIESIVGPFNRWISAMHTSYNPEFIITNAVRDFQHATFMIFAQEGLGSKYMKDFQKQYIRGLKRSLGLYKRWRSGTLDLSSNEDKMFHDFMINGGQTGYTQISKIEDLKKKVEWELKKAKGEAGRMKVGFEILQEGLELFNGAIELNTRFATFVASRKSGRSIERSISDAKNITVNFNKKGAGGYGAAFFQALYIFFNPAVQALEQSVRVSRKNPKRVAAMIGTMATLAYLQPILFELIGAAAGGDDDDEDAYDNINQNSRLSSLIIRNPLDTSTYINLPISPELKPFFTLGSALAEVQRGAMTPSEATGQILQGMTSLLPLDPAGGNGDKKWINIVPSVVQPLEQVAVNINYYGEPIYKDNGFNKLDPEWTKAKDANPIFTKTSEMLNEWSGGNKVRKGEIDINPEKVEHIVEGFTGGAGKATNALFKTFMMPFDSDMRKLNNTVMLRKFYKAIPQAKDGVLSRRIYELQERRKELLEHDKLGYKKQLRESKDTVDRAYWMDKMMKLVESPEYQFFKKNKVKLDILFKLRDKYQKVTNDESRKTISKSMNKIQKEILKDSRTEL